MKEIWAVVHREREALSEDMHSVNTQQWSTLSLCPGWDVHDILAHLTDDATTTRLSFVARMLAARFDFDRVNATGVARERCTDPAQTLARFDHVRTRTTSAPAPLVTRLVEVFVHGEDVRGPAIALLLAASGRPLRAGELTGHGTSLLTTAN